MRPLSKYKTLEHFLDDYKQTGVDSEGQFTLNPDRARELLKQFQLPEAAHYVLHVVSFLVGAGAKGISISSTRSGLRFEAPGAEIESETIKSPFSVLLQSRAKPHLSELALALNTLLGQSGGHAELAYDKWTAKYSPNTIKISEGSATALLSLSTGPRLGEAERELELVREGFRWCHIPIRINGQILPPPQAGFSEGLEVQLENQNYPMPLGTNAQNRVVKKIQAPFSALLRIGRQRPQFRIVQLGRSYERPMPWEFVAPGWNLDITVTSDQFKKDLSQQDILENDKYQNLLKSLRAQLEFATELLLNQVPSLVGTEELVDDLVELLFRQGQAQHAYQFQVRLVQHLGLTGGTKQKGRALYRLGLIENSLNAGALSRYLKLGLEMLKSVPGLELRESDWIALKAQMAFRAPDATMINQVAALASRGPSSLIREYCYRWLLSQRSVDPRSASGYRIELARLAFDAGRLTEAVTQLDAAQNGPEARFLEENPETHLKAVQLRGELAFFGGHVEKSLEMFGRQLTLLREMHGQYSLELGLTLERLAGLLDHVGQSKQAQEYRAWSRRLYQ